jgi:hypothetical protein
MAHNVNPDLIKAGDQVTLASANGVQSIWEVAVRQPTRLLVEAGGEVKSLPLNGRRSPFVIVAHQPRLI